MSCRVSAIVVAYSDETRVTLCLHAVSRALAAIDDTTELLVVLNRTDYHALSERGSWTVMDIGHNAGFAGGVEAGLRNATGEWVALVNDDCIVAPNALAELLKVGETSPDVGSVAAKIVFANRTATINSAGLEVDRLGVARERLLGLSTDAPRREEVVEVFGASAAAALYRRAMLDAIGGFDASFFAYLEDADVAWRARMSGWRALYAPGAVAVHRHSGALGHRSPQKYFLVGRNRVRMLAKNATRQQLLRHGVAIAVYDLAYVAYASARYRTLAPLRGRVSGLREWRTYRRRGTALRAPITMAEPAGFSAAIARDRAYR